jgi:O-antigen ligase
MANFGNFVRAFAQRYGQQIDYYQVWHQPNLSAGWGDTFVDPGAYADLLREAALNIRVADPEAYILTGALAATLEEGPLNLNELAYLDQLYTARAERWFDIVAVQPYGLWTKPLDAPQPALLNFRRAELVRQVMLNHGDGETPVWATAFGWVALPADWTGKPSPWSHDLPSVQAPRTAQAIAYARQNWPWLGPMLAARWDAAGLAPDDPARGFALLETPTILDVIQTATAEDTVATPGFYPANHPSGRYSQGWRFALTLADIPHDAPRTLTIPFEGTRIELLINRGDFRGYLWVTIDGQPANALPQDSEGRSYIILYDPLRERARVTLAQHLPPGRHELVIEAEGGWEQWALEGWQVTSEMDRRPWQAGFIIAGLLTGLSGLGLLWQFGRLLTEMPKVAWVWAGIFVARYAAFGEPGHLLITFGLAILIYLFQGWVALALMPLLALVILIRPDLGLALVALALFFFQIPLRLPIASFSPVELTLALTLLGFLFRALLLSGNHRPITGQDPRSKIRAEGPLWENPKSMDWAVLSLVLLALLVTFTAEHFEVSLREWRVVVFESAIFYFLVRLGADYSPLLPASARRWAWRLIDAFVAGAMVQAAIALYLYFFTNRSIDAEGVHRALGLGYGSPNNLALMLGRAWPILLAVSLLDKGSTWRRGVYGIGLLLVSLALYLTFSKGALLLGLPAAILAITLLYGLRGGGRQWRRVLILTASGLLIVALALIPFSQTERFQTTFDFGNGRTGFFRLKLWEASWAMLGDHWLLGVGLDNFLYLYRTRYILPEAWQEPNLSHPHNLFLDFGLHLGIGGLAILFWLQVAFWQRAWRLFRRQAEPLILGLMGSMVIFLSHGLVDNSYFLVDLAFTFCLTIGIVQRLDEAEIDQEFQL